MPMLYTIIKTLTFVIIVNIGVAQNFISTYSDGIIREKGDTINGQKTGAWFFYYPNGHSVTWQLQQKLI